MAKMVCFLLLAFFVITPAAAQAVCYLAWNAVTTDVEGDPVPAAEIRYRVYVAPISQPLDLTHQKAETAETSIPCADVGFVSGTHVQARTLHVPSGSLSEPSNTLIYIVLPNAPANVHIEHR